MHSAERPESGIEQERQSEEVLSEILKAHEAEKHARESGGEEWREEHLAKLPAEARKEISAMLRDMQSEGLSEKGLNRALEREVSRFETAYRDRKYEAYRPEYGTVIAKEWIGELFDGDAKMEDLKRVARLSFDANGLKAVNDLSGSHEAGDAYLRRLSDLFNDAAHPARETLRAHGVTDVIATKGGDEFVLMVRGKEALTPEALREAVAAYEQAVAALDVSDLVDFADSSVRRRYLGISEKEYRLMDDAAKADADARFQKEAPPDFRMRASAAGGAATLFEGFRAATADRRESKKLSKSDPYPRALQKMLGGLTDVSDGRSNDAKEDFKSRLTGGEAEEKFYSKVLKRTTEARVLEEKADTMAAKVAAAERARADIAALMAIDGVDDAIKLKRAAEIMARLDS